jgi:hypothetical protein
MAAESPALSPAHQTERRPVEKSARREYQRLEGAFALDVDPLLAEPLQFHKILDDGRPMAGVDDLVSFAEHKDPLAAHRYVE